MLAFALVGNLSILVSLDTVCIVMKPESPFVSRDHADKKYYRDLNMHGRQIAWVGCPCSGYSSNGRSDTGNIGHSLCSSAVVISYLGSAVSQGTKCLLYLWRAWSMECIHGAKSDCG
jgi:hypothetical protein